MKLPKVWGPFDPLASAPGISKSNSLEIINAPFLTASGPGFKTYKKDGFTKIILEGGANSPFMWGITTFSDNDEAMSIGDPSTGAVLSVGATTFATNLGIRAGAGYVLAVARDAATNDSWPILVDVDMHRTVVHYNETMKMVLDKGPLGVGISLASMFATGKDENGYRWGVAQFGYLTPPTEGTTADDVNTRFIGFNYDTNITAMTSWLTRDGTGTVVPGPSQPVTYAVQTAVDLTGVSPAQIGTQSHYRSFVVHLGDTVPPKHPGDARRADSITLVDGTTVDRECDVAGPFCIGPGMLAALVVPNDHVKIPGSGTETTTNTDTFIQTLDIYGTYWGADVAIPIHFPTVDQFIVSPSAIERSLHESFLPSIPPYLMISADHGETWAKTNLEDVIGVRLPRAPGTSTFISGSHPTTTTIYGYYDGYDPAQLSAIARGFYMCYIGEGKSIVLVPALTAREGGTLGSAVSGILKPFTEQVACFLLDNSSLKATQIPWPGDGTRTNVDPASHGRVGRTMSGCFGVGCFMVLDRDRQVFSTRDFGSTWTATPTDFPEAAFGSHSFPLPLWPTVISPYKTSKSPDGSVKVLGKGMVVFSYPGAESVFTTYSDGEFKVYWNFGNLFTANPKSPSPTPAPSFTPNYYTLYYGRSGLRANPRHELGSEFTTVKKTP